MMTRTMPAANLDFCPNLRPIAFLYEWADMGPTLLDDVAAERQTMDSIFEYIKQSSLPVQNWIYGHFHESWTSFIGGIRFKMLDIMEFYEIR